MSTCPLICEAGPQARSGWLMGRARASGTLGLVPPHCWVEPSLGIPGCQGPTSPESSACPLSPSLEPVHPGGHGLVQAHCRLEGLFSYCVYLAAPDLSCSTQDIFSCSRWDLVSRPGIEPRPPAWGVWGLSHWTTGEVPAQDILRQPARWWTGLCPHPARSLA